MRRVRTRATRFSYTVGRGYDAVQMWRKGVGEESGGGDVVKGRAATLFPFNSANLGACSWDLVPRASVIR